MPNFNLALTYDVVGVVSLPKEGEISVMLPIEIAGQKDQMHFKNFRVKGKNASSIRREIALHVYREERDKSRIFRLGLALRAHHSLAFEVMSVCLRQTRNFATWNLKDVVQISSIAHEEYSRTAAPIAKTFGDYLDLLTTNSEQRDEYGPRRVLLVRKKWHCRGPHDPMAKERSADI